MDDLVVQAMQKWPHVPHCFNWLGLDGRGRWWLRDDATQARGAFASDISGARGSLLTHPKLIEFIGRNYQPDETGRWYFQNGPQRVFVELQHTPWVWRVSCTQDTAPEVISHTGQTTQPSACLLDEQGYLYLLSPLGLGLVHTLDTAYAAQAIESGLWQPEPVQRKDLAHTYGFVLSPATSL